MSDQNITELIVGIKDDFHKSQIKMNDSLTEIKLQMQRNTDSLIHHEERTSLLHEEVNIVKNSFSLAIDELKKSMNSLQEVMIKSKENKKTKKEIFGFWIQVFVGLAQIATVASVAYLFLS